jgi:hypothetical protein
MIALVAAAASGRDAVAGGPQRFGHPRRHQRVAAPTHATEATVVAAHARRRHGPVDAR